MSQRPRPSSIIETNTSCHGSIFKFHTIPFNTATNSNNNNTRDSDKITEYELHNLIRGEGMRSVQDDPSEPDNHRRQETAIDTSPDLVPKDDVNDNPKETKKKRTEDITAIKQALASDKDRDPESLHFALCTLRFALCTSGKENYYTNSETSDTSDTHALVPLSRPDTHSSIEYRCRLMNPVVSYFHCDNPPREKVGFLVQ